MFQVWFDCDSIKFLKVISHNLNFPARLRRNCRNNGILLFDFLQITILNVDLKNMISGINVLHS